MKILREPQMNKKALIIAAIVSVILVGGLALSNSIFHFIRLAPLARKTADIYYCPMHPYYHADKPGDCPICNMSLVKSDKDHPLPGKIKSGGTVLYYRNPMDPSVTSPTPLKDSMGMDYIPVYASNAVETTGTPGTVSISPDRQKLLGIETVKAAVIRMIKEIRVTGKVAYDPDLYVAQVEYLRTLRDLGGTMRSNAALGANQYRSLLSSAERKLILMGMSKNLIRKMVRQGRPQENLYYPADRDSVWIYMTVYENDLGAVSEGQKVSVTAVAYPGKVFTGTIGAIASILDPETRAVQVRAETANPGHLLKPEMFVDAEINSDLGMRLAIPATAVMNTGERNVVFVKNSDDTFSMREVSTGVRTGALVEIVSGLKAGESVVSSGNFFVDSESRLKSAVSE
jgi:Cu(I)/Ag(I) efflux system membrane fusion protein